MSTKRQQFAERLRQDSNITLAIRIETAADLFDGEGSYPATTAVLREAARRLSAPEEIDSGWCRRSTFVPADGDPGHCAICGEYDTDHVEEVKT